MSSRLARWFSATPDEVRERDAGRIEVSAALREFIDAVNSVESEEDSAYVSAVAALLADADSSVQEAIRIEIEAPVNDIGLRRSALMALTAMPRPDAAMALRRVALRPVDTIPIPGETSIAEAQLGLRMQAVDGLASMAAKGIEEAREGLLEAALSESLAVQALALASVRDLPDGETETVRLLTQIPEERRYLSALRRVSIHDVPQVTGVRSTLLRERGSNVVAPDLAGGTRRADSDREGSMDTPRVDGGGRRDE